jgi:competence protein ComEC
MRQPLSLLTIAFCAGIAVAGSLTCHFWIIYGLAWALGIALIAIRRESASVVVSCALVFLCGIAAMCNAQHLPRCHVSGYLRPGAAQNCILKGFISDEPSRDGDTICFRLETEEVQLDGINQSSCGAVTVTGKMPHELRYGQVIIVQGELKTSRSPYRADKGIKGVLRFRAPADVVIQPQQKGSRCKRLALEIKRRAEGMIYRYTPSAPGAVIDAMLLGERKEIPRSIINAMMKSGTIHILVVSGFNVGLVAAVVMLALKVARLGRRARLFLAIPILSLYCLATGASPPVVRATIMAIVMMSACIFSRQADIVSALSCAACAILAQSPGQLFDIGFQLSFASVFAIVWLYPRLRRMLRIDAVRPALARWCLDNFLVSLSAWLATLGFIAYYFKFFAPVTVLANIVVVPLASLVTLCGISLVAAGFLCPGLAPFVSRTCELLILLMVGANNFFLSLPGAYVSLKNF